MSVIYFRRPLTSEEFLNKYDLYSDYLAAIKKIKEDDYLSKYLDKHLPVFEESIEIIINSPFNKEYKIANLKHMFNNSPHYWRKDNIEFAIKYDPKGTIKYLEKKNDKSLSDALQLMVLYQIYQPKKIKSKLYEELTDFSHQQILEYFAQQKFQSSWRSEEYNELIKNDYKKCYAELKCLLDILPYWMNWEADFTTYIPCEIAQKYNKVAYFDVAGGGHGSQSFITSDCPLYSKYKYPKELNKYYNMLFQESVPYSDGSIRFLYYARTNYKSLTDTYSPKFDMPKQTDWKDFPYTDWSVQSYYTFKKYNEVLNYGIGYKKALEELTDHYVKNFNVSQEQAYNTALYTLQIPSMDKYDLISKDNLNYMLLTGQDIEEILNKHNNLKNYQNLLHLSIAHPKNLQHLIELGQAEKSFDIDYNSTWYGKTPLMIAAQYGYLDSVKILLENNANINKQTQNGDCWSEYGLECIYNGKRTALMYALQEGQFEVAKYLIKNNADISLRDDKNNSALDYMLGIAPLRGTKNLDIASGIAGHKNDDTPKSPFTKEQQEYLLPLLTPAENENIISN